MNGQTVYAVVDGLGAFTSLAHRFLSEVGIGKLDGGIEYIFDLNAWYPHEDWLKAFERIAKEIGDSTLFKIGEAIPKNAQFPPWVKDIKSAIKSIDIAYHMNHRKNNIPLFNPTTGAMTEGIGHYGFERIPGKKMIISECKNPYPCSFDKGIITAMAQKFELRANVVHDNAQPCRKNGADSCTYIVTW